VIGIREIYAATPLLTLDGVKYQECLRLVIILSALSEHRPSLVQHWLLQIFSMSSMADIWGKRHSFSTCLCCGHLRSAKSEHAPINLSIIAIAHFTLAVDSGKYSLNENRGSSGRAKGRLGLMWL
jgi:hypothetical protein